jgi:hypothetical protein
MGWHCVAHFGSSQTGSQIFKKGNQRESEGTVGAGLIHSPAHLDADLGAHRGIASPRARGMAPRVYVGSSVRQCRFSRCADRQEANRNEEKPTGRHSLSIEREKGRRGEGEERQGDYFFKRGWLEEFGVFGVGL